MAVKEYIVDGDNITGSHNAKTSDKVKITGRVSDGKHIHIYKHDIHSCFGLLGVCPVTTGGDGHQIQSTAHGVYSIEVRISPASAPEVRVATSNGTINVGSGSSGGGGGDDSHHHHHK